MANPTVAEFWQQQTFAYLETYSFNRGPKSAEEYERLSQEIAVIKEALASGRPMLRSKASRQLRDLEEEITGNKYNLLLTKDVLFHFSTRQIANLAVDALATKQLAGIALHATAQEGYAMCPPIYRDALVFRDAQGEQLQVLNICFECLSMATNDKQLVEANFATYDLLKAVLIDLGHPIERR